VRVFDVPAAWTADRETLRQEGMTTPPPPSPTCTTRLLPRRRAADRHDSGTPAPAGCRRPATAPVGRPAARRARHRAAAG
jgi:hypothetical protein